MTDAAVSRTPVEVWREIIDWVLFDPILFLTDPFYPGCSLHTALDDFSNHRRLIDLSVQRATLRLVSRSWKNAVDRSPWQYFEPPHGNSEDLNHLASQLQSARRLEFYEKHLEHILINPRCCDACKENILDVKDGTMNYLFRLTSEPVRAKILRVSFRDQNAYPSINQLVGTLPNLRALFLTTYTSPALRFLGLLSRLEFMSLQLYLDPGDSTMIAPQSCSFPLLKTLQIEIIQEHAADLLVPWETPLLTHLHLQLKSWEGLSALIQIKPDTFGANLISLRLQSDQELLALPNSIWDTMPRLEYLGVSRLMQAPIPPPLGHPLHTFADLESYYVENLKDVAYTIVESWSMLSTIADLHDWTEVPDDFANDCDGPFHLNHDHTRVSCCWLCIKTFYMACRQRGLRYEDCTGRTFEEVWPET